MIKHFIFNIILICFSFVLITCSSCNKKGLENQQDTFNHSSVSSSKLYIDSTLINRFRQHLDSCDARTAEFINRLLPIIYRFAGRQIDTSISVVGQIDGFGYPDTIQTHIYSATDSIIVEHRWTRLGYTIWQYRYTNPYLWIDGSNLFQYDTRSIWVTFAIGILYSVPTFYPTRDYFKSEDISIELGISELKDYGIDIAPETYRHYLHDFKGDLISYGEPDGNGGIKIWYEPAKLMLTFYHP